MTKLLFIDIDGVLTSSIRGNSYLCGDPKSYTLDPECMNNLMTILNSIPNCKVVIHSNWRKHQYVGSCVINGKVYFSLMPSLIDKLGDRYIGSPAHYQGNNKGGDIKNYLEINKFSEVRGVILDDSDTDDLSSIDYRLKFVKCDSDVGLTLNDASRVINLLNS